MASETFMKEPICLIQNTPEGGLHVNPEAVKILEGITQPMVVVAIVGLYRTGKSYLMNALAGKRKGFQLGSTIQSQTKGIWMWCVPHPEKCDHALVLLDTEGLGDVEKGDPKHDTWVFALAVLLSSTLVYNSVGTIDQDAMDKLHFVSELSEYIRVKAHMNEETAADTEYVKFFPNFIWAVRDFKLKLEMDGNVVTEDEYLERALMLKKGRSREVMQYNLPRQCIQDYFPTRKCFVFITPANDDDLDQLESLPDNSLRSEFLEQSNRFCQYVLQESRVKMLKGGHHINGRRFAHLTQIYVETISSGGVPCLENAVTALAIIENEAAVQEGLAHYMDQMEIWFKFPATAVLSETHKACKKAAMQLFVQRAFKCEEQKYQKELMDRINEHFKSVLSKNEAVSRERCWTLLTQLSADMEKKLGSGVYMKVGGYEEYVKDQEQVVESFQKEPNTGVKADEVLQEFLDSRKGEAASVLAADKMLTDVEKRLADEQAKVARLEQENKVEEEEWQQLEQRMRDLEHSHQESIREMETKMEEEITKLRQETEQAMECKLTEQAKMLQQGFIERASLLKNEIEQLKKEEKVREEKVLQQAFTGKVSLMKERTESLKKQGKEWEDKFQQGFTEKAKPMKDKKDMLKKQHEMQEKNLQENGAEVEKEVSEVPDGVTSEENMYRTDVRSRVKVFEDKIARMDNKH